MIPTYGLTHLALAVQDVERSLRFYHQLLGAEPYFREEDRIHIRTPGCHDVITLDQTLPEPGRSAGIIHFGFRLRSPGDIDAAVRAAEDAGGKLLRRGEFAPGFPYAYISDPDGYEVEIWFE
jgi:catechol 2,3-dioxygenase-like lactoylglutathione lyase family enzyme